MSDHGFAHTLDSFARHVNPPYIAFLRRLGLDGDFVRSERALVYDRSGRSFIDCVAGYGNLNLGHNHPEIIAAVVDELRSPRPFNWPFLSAAHARLAMQLARVSPGNLECSLIVNSGAEAVDSALKLARLVTGKPHVIAARGAWHGFTIGALSVSEPTMCQHFGPLLADVTRVPYGDAAAVEQAVGESTGAVIVEPIQAENGALVPPTGYLGELASLCRRKEIMLIFDEIKTGMGKTGRVFACEHEDAVPDVLLVGKSLGGGVMPIGAVVAHRKWWGTFGYNFAMSSSSSGGNAPACAAAVATLDALEKERLCEQAAARGDELGQGLRRLALEFPEVLKGASGRGLLAALHADSMGTAIEIIKGCIRKGILVMSAFCDRTRILIEPPLCITPDQLGAAIDVMTEAVKEAATKRLSH